MSNAAKFETPDAADNGKVYVYSSGTDAHVLTDMATQAELDAHAAAGDPHPGYLTTAEGNAAYEAAGGLAAHLADTVDAHDASAVSFAAVGTIAGTDVQTAVAEVATDAASALSTHEADTTSIHGIANTALLLTTSSGIDALGDVTITAAAAGDIIRHDGAAWVDAVGTTHFEVAGAVATHEADTTSVHGIANTANLLTTSSGIDALSDVTITAAASGDILRHNGSAWVDAVGTTHFEAAGAVTTHEAAGDPHPGYLTAAEGNAAYQPLDAELTALASTTSAANKVPYFTGSGSAAVADLTAAGRTLIAGADADAQLATLAAVDRENGGLETLASNATSTGAVTVNLSNGNLHHLTLTGNTTLTLSGATNGKVCSLTLLLTQDGTGGRSVTWPASVKWMPAGAAPSFTTTASTRSIVELFTIDGGTTWFAGLAGTGIA